MDERERGDPALKIKGFGGNVIIVRCPHRVEWMKHLPLFFLTFSLMIVTGCRQTVSVTVGLTDGKLRPCPDKYNCVCTQDPVKRHRIEPLHYTGTQEETREKLLMVVRRMAQSTLVKADADYIHVEFRSAFFEFVDDVEFLFDDAAKLIHFRSAARTGYYDFDVNRKRMEEIRKRFMGPG
jgi:uncharacterized protein (DUF1499 family)